MKSMREVNLETYSLSLLTAKEDILNPRSSTNWALFAYDGIMNRLKLADSGVGGLKELSAKLHPRRPLYGMCRVGTAQPCIVMILWVGNEVDEYRRAECASHLPAIRAFFKEVHIFLPAHTLDEITEERICTLAYNAAVVTKGPRGRPGRRMEDRQGIVGTNYKRTIAAAEIQRIQRDSFWAQAEREEEERKKEEQRRAAEDRRQRERERMLQEKREAMERERRLNEKEQKIKEQRRIQAQMEAEAHKQHKLKWEHKKKEREEEEMRARYFRSESEEKSAEAAALASQRVANPREFFRQLSSSSMHTASGPTSPYPVRSPCRQLHRSQTDSIFSFNESPSSTPASPYRSSLASPYFQSIPTSQSPTLFTNTAASSLQNGVTVSVKSQIHLSSSKIMEPFAITAAGPTPCPQTQSPSTEATASETESHIGDILESLVFYPPPLTAEQLKTDESEMVDEFPPPPSGFENSPELAVNLPEILVSPLDNLMSSLPPSCLLVPEPPARPLPALPVAPQMLKDLEPGIDFTARALVISTVEEEGVEEENEEREIKDEGKDVPGRDGERRGHEEGKGGQKEEEETDGMIMEKHESEKESNGKMMAKYESWKKQDGKILEEHECGKEQDGKMLEEHDCGKELDGKILEGCGSGRKQDNKMLEGCGRGREQHENMLEGNESGKEQDGKMLEGCGSGRGRGKDGNTLEEHECGKEQDGEILEGCGSGREPDEKMLEEHECGKEQDGKMLEEHESRKEQDEKTLEEHECGKEQYEKLLEEHECGKEQDEKILEKQDEKMLEEHECGKEQDGKMLEGCGSGREPDDKMLEGNESGKDQDGKMLEERGSGKEKDGNILEEHECGKEQDGKMLEGCGSGREQDEKMLEELKSGKEQDGKMLEEHEKMLEEHESGKEQDGKMLEEHYKMLEEHECGKEQGGKMLEGCGSGKQQDGNILEEHESGKEQDGKMLEGCGSGKEQDGKMLEEHECGKEQDGIFLGKCWGRREQDGKMLEECESGKEQDGEIIEEEESEKIQDAKIMLECALQKEEDREITEKHEEDGKECNNEEMMEVHEQDVFVDVFNNENQKDGKTMDVFETEKYGEIMNELVVDKIQDGDIIEEHESGKEEIVKVFETEKMQYVEIMEERKQENEQNRKTVETCESEYESEKVQDMKMMQLHDGEEQEGRRLEEQDWEIMEELESEKIQHAKMMLEYKREKEQECKTGERHEDRKSLEEYKSEKEQGWKMTGEESNKIQYGNIVEDHESEKGQDGMMENRQIRDNERMSRVDADRPVNVTVLKKDESYTEIIKRDEATEGVEQGKCDNANKKEEMNTPLIQGEESNADTLFSQHSPPFPESHGTEPSQHNDASIPESISTTQGEPQMNSPPQINLPTIQVESDLSSLSIQRDSDEMKEKTSEFVDSQASSENSPDATSAEKGPNTETHVTVKDEQTDAEMLKEVTIVDSSNNLNLGINTECKTSPISENQARIGQSDEREGLVLVSHFLQDQDTELELKHCITHQLDSTNVISDVEEGEEAISLNVRDTDAEHKFKCDSDSDQENEDKCLQNYKTITETLSDMRNDNSADDK